MFDWLIGPPVYGLRAAQARTGDPYQPLTESAGSFQFYEDSAFWNEVKYGQRFPCGWDERDAKV